MALSLSCDNPTNVKEIFYFHMTGFGRFAGIDDNPAKFTIENFQQQLKIQSSQPEIQSTLQSPSLQSNTGNYSTLFQSMLKQFTPNQQHEQQEQQQQQQSSPSQALIQTSNFEVYINTTTLQVDVETVEEYFALKYNEIQTINNTIIQQYQQQEQQVNIHHHFIHVGVHGGSQAIAMEEYAYNNATFRCPDELGFTPFSIPIRFVDNNGNIFCKVLETTPLQSLPNKCVSSPQQQQQQQKQQQTSRYFISPRPEIQPPPTLPHAVKVNSHYPSTIKNGFIPQDICFDAVLQSQLHFNTIHPRLIEFHSKFTTPNQNQVPPISITADPGGFVCNYIYFVSLYYTHFLFPFLSPQQSTIQQNITIDYSSLFFHIPLEKISSIQNNINVLFSTILAILFETNRTYNQSLSQPATAASPPSDNNDDQQLQRQQYIQQQPLTRKTSHPTILHGCDEFHHITIYNNRLPRDLTIKNAQKHKRLRQQSQQQHYQHHQQHQQNHSTICYSNEQKQQIFDQIAKDINAFTE